MAHKVKIDLVLSVKDFSILGLAGVFMWFCFIL